MYSFAALRFVSRSMVPCLLRLVLRRLAWVTAAVEGWCRIITAVLMARRSYAARNSWIRLLMPEGAGLSRSSRRLDQLGLRSGPAVVWHPVHLFLGHAAAAVRYLNRRIAAQRVRVAAVTRCISAVGRPLCQVCALTGAS